MIISAIVAASQNGIIGVDNQIPWYLPADLKYFKKVTSGHHVLMGRKCYESIGKALPGRTNLVLTRNPYYLAQGTLVIHTIEEGINIAKQNNETEFFIIGGADVYKSTMHLWDKLYFNTIHSDIEGDTSWPDMDWQDWSLTSVENHEADEKNKFPYSFSVFTKRR
jgi:dihydrofolate reductase